MYYWLDAEFDVRGHDDAFNLISMAIVSEDGREYLGVSNEFIPELCDDWVKLHVLPQLPPKNTWKSLPELMEEIIAFVGQDKEPKFIGFYSSHDWAMFCHIFHKMIHMPPSFPGWCFDIRQWIATLELTGVDSIALKQAKPPKPVDAHNALADAYWTRDFWQNVVNLAGYQAP
jgi:hypothetical protein